MNITEHKRTDEELRLLLTLTQAINEAKYLNAAMQIALKKVCEATGWDYGEAWIPGKDKLNLECSSAWYLRDGILGRFRELSEVFTFPKGNVTSRKRAERNFQRLIESLPDAVIAIDSNYVILLVNAHTEKIFGYTRKELLGKKYDMLIPERFREAHVGHCTGYFAEPVAKTMALHLAAFAMHRDGSEFPVEINMSPMETEEGVIVLIDIREKK